MSHINRDYGIEDRAIRQCRQLGLSPDEAQSYVRQSAPFSHQMFNRRYDEFLFRVERRTIVEVGLYNDHRAGPRRQDTQALALLDRCLPELELLVGFDQSMSDDETAGLEILIDDVETYLKGDQG